MSAQLDDRLREAHTRVDPGPAPASTRARLAALIAADDDAATIRRRGWRPFAVFVAAAAGLAVVALIAVASLPRSGGPSGIASARAACASPAPGHACGAALRAAAGSWSIPGSGDVLYQRGRWAVSSFTVTARPTGAPNEIVLRTATEPFVVSSTGTEELWLAPDGSGRVAHSRSGTISLPTPHDRAAWEAAGRPGLATLVPPVRAEDPSSSELPPGSADSRLLGANGLYDVLPHSGDPLAALPLRPAALAAWLRVMSWQRRGRGEQRCIASGEGCTAAIRRLIDDTIVSDIETILAYPATPPKLRAGLVAVLTQRPGTRSLGLIRDPGGRQVAAVALGGGRHDGDGANVIAFDPVSGELRGIGSASGTAVRWMRIFAVVSVRVPAVGDRS